MLYAHSKALKTQEETHQHNASGFFVGKGYD
jgi:hypothetical protein